MKIKRRSHASVDRYMSVAACILAALMCVSPPSGLSLSACADNIDDQLLHCAPSIVEHLRTKGCRNVGVLTFMLEKDNEPSRFHGALICDNIAERLSNSLILACPRDESGLNVVRNASKVAAQKIVGASYRTAENRRRLFEIPYPLDYGPEVVPDIFLAGKVTVSLDLRKARVAIGAFERQDPSLVYDVLEFDVPVDRQILADVGEGYSLSKHRSRFVRGFADDEILDSVDVDRRARKKEDRGDEYGRAEAWSEGFPVTLTIFYDGVEQELRSDSEAHGRSNFTVSDPHEGQRVTFGLRNETDYDLSVVLTVNGISTLHEKVGPAAELPKWILKPKKYYLVKGYHAEDHKTYVKIAGISNELSEAVFEDLGGEKTAGLVHLHVFRPVSGITGTAPAFTRSIGRLSAADLAKRPVRSFSDLRTALIDRSVLEPNNIRGLMFHSLEKGDEILKERDLGPVECTDTMTVQYYKRPAGSSGN